jgi:hypothetical protein
MKVRGKKDKIYIRQMSPKKNLACHAFPLCKFATFFSQLHAFGSPLNQCGARSVPRMV